MGGYSAETQADERMRIAVLIPCLNEEASVGKVVRDMAEALPQAAVYVYDNRSTDRTSEVARAAGAVVRQEYVRGKGHVVNRMFADIEADVYVLIDGDDTYDASSAGLLVKTLIEGSFDMVNAVRQTEEAAAYRIGHRMGNVLLTTIARMIFGTQITDMLSGYRAFSRRFVKSFAGFSTGFEIETELTVHALDMRMPIAEIKTKYRTRPEDSASKLRTIRDGLRILNTLFTLLREEKPLTFFGIVSIILAVAALAVGAGEAAACFRSGAVPSLPIAVTSSSLMILSVLSAVCGLILNTVTRGRKEMKRLHYLSFPGPTSRSS